MNDVFEEKMKSGYNLKPMIEEIDEELRQLWTKPLSANSVTQVDSFMAKKEIH